MFLPMALILVFRVMGRSFPAHAHFSVRAYGQTSNICHHQLFLKIITNILINDNFFEFKKPVTQRINSCQDEI
jgi:hypothetical protein